MTTVNVEAEIASLTSRIKTRKEEAKDYRDEGDFRSAINILNEAVAMMRNSPLYPGLQGSGPATPSEKTLALHLADCLGMIGGNYRRMGDLDEALRQFELGRVYEEADRLDVNSSYNLVNAITLPLEKRSMTVTEQHDSLKRAVAAIDRQVHGERRNDRWAWADLGLCQLLLGDIEAARNSYRRMQDLGDSETARSVLAVMRRLQGALEDSDPKAANWLRRGVLLFET